MSEANNEMIQVSEKNLDYLRSLRHDIRNQYSYAEILLENGQYDEAKKFFRSIGNDIDVSLAYVDSGNKNIDAIINMEMSKADAKGVKTDVSVVVPPRLPFSDTALCSIISNLIDNAVEACVRFDLKQQGVCVRIYPRQDYLYICVKNTLPSDVDRDRLLSLNTVKSDSVNHGYGTQIVKRLVAQYDGYVTYSVENDEFIAEAMINMMSDKIRKSGGVIMNKLTIAVCDDDETALIAIRGTIVGLLEKLKIPATVDTFTSPELFDKAFDGVNYGLVFLDIEMPKLNGIDLGQKIKEKNSTAEIIFISNRENLVFDTFKVHPFGFVRKSRFIKDLSEVLRLYIDMHNATAIPETITIKYHGGETKIACNDITHIEGARDYQHIYINGKAEPLRLRESMDTFMKQLEPLGFIRIHKGYIVNFRYIRRIDNTSVTLTTNVELPLARRLVDVTRAKYMQLCRASGTVRLN